MPIERVMVCTRPNFDAATLYASYWVGVTLRLLEERGLRVTDLYGGLANLDKLVEALNVYDPVSFWGVGHGNETQFAGQDAIIILERGVNEQLFIGRIVHLTSCLTGAVNGLLESMVKVGVVAAIGYTVELIVGIDTPSFPSIDPTNKATQSFLEPDCRIEISLAEGKTIVGAFVDSDSKSNEWIEYWRRSGHDDTDLIIWALINNRDHKTVYGVPEFVTRTLTEPLQPLTIATSIASLIGLGLIVIKW